MRDVLIDFQNNNTDYDYYSSYDLNNIFWFALVELIFKMIMLMAGLKRSRARQSDSRGILPH